LSERALKVLLDTLSLNSASDLAKDLILCPLKLVGSIFETEKRKRVVPLLYAQVAVFIAEVAFLSESSS